MNLDQIISIITPALSGIAGIITAAFAFKLRIKKTVDLSKQVLKENESVRAELKAAKSAVVELNQKIAYLVEQAKKEARNAK